MPAFVSNELLQLLTDNVQHTITQIKNLQGLNDEALNRQPDTGKWSIAQIIEHLNSYNRYYIPEIEKAISKGSTAGFTAGNTFKAGWFGNYFTNMMQPKENGKIVNKMQAPKDHRPAQRLDSSKVIDEFIRGQEKIMQLLAEAKRTNIGKLRVPISISRMIKLKLGDTFRFLIAHQIRHFVQIDNTGHSIGLPGSH